MTTAPQNSANSLLPLVIEKHLDRILDTWIAELQVDGGRLLSLIRESELRDQAARFLDLLRKAIKVAGVNPEKTAAYDELRDLLDELSRSRSEQGFTPTETATFVFSLKRPLFRELKLAHDDNDTVALLEDIWQSTMLLDRLGLNTTEVFIATREAIIQRQQQDLLELSTPVVSLWKGILALPVIGTLDSERTQTVMESLLQKIVATGSDIAIIDITGVPAVDTLVAQHLLKTVTAARLMGAECIISGIRPQIAQTIVHLGVELGNVTTKGTLADAFALALKKKRQKIDEI
ncbi:MAG: STAS domain-containing protein [Verrucomicrobiota bacterium JB022]|nr:STAS domain-containing protein [Verrucomicrobiota bacterium JB022]